jgi:hypothetical protein
MVASQIFFDEFVGIEGLSVGPGAVILLGKGELADGDRLSLGKGDGAVGDPQPAFGSLG